MHAKTGILFQVIAPQRQRMALILHSARSWIGNALYDFRSVNRGRRKAEQRVLEAAINPASIRIPACAGRPDVSVIIPAYGKVRYTLRCLNSIAAAARKVRVEVIVAEDASGDTDISILRQVEGVTLVENRENLGFLRSCNAAAGHARGEFLYFLNNDTELEPAAIDSLVELARARPDAGAVGSKLVYPDGLLQEAGGIVWSDGSTTNYGWRDDPRKPQYNYVREADYVSGASLLVGKTLWDSLGGFDETFAPAYYEDTDFSFRVRGAGLRVLYQPRSVVVHHEGISHRKQKNVAIGNRLNENRGRFVTRWGEQLKREHYEPGTQEMRARDRAKGRSVAIVVAEDPLSAGQVIDAFMGLGWIVKLCAPQGNAESFFETLQQRGVEVVPYPPRPRRLRRTNADWDAVIELRRQRF